MSTFKLKPAGRKLARRLDWRGLAIAVENEVGSVRPWKGGETVMSAPYGYVMGTRGALEREHDGGANHDCIDVYLGGNESSERVFVVRQLHPGTGAYDEDKAFIGFSSLEDAKTCFQLHRDDARAFGGIGEISWAEFAAWCIDRENWGRSIRVALQKALEASALEKSVGTTSPASARASVMAYSKNPKNHAKLLAKWRVQSALRSGKMKRGHKCAVCGKTTGLQFHHNKGHDGKHALTGRWLCRAHHVKSDPKLHGSAMAHSMKTAKKRA